MQQIYFIGSKSESPRSVRSDYGLNTNSSKQRYRKQRPAARALSLILWRLNHGQAQANDTAQGVNQAITLSAPKQDTPPVRTYKDTVIFTSKRITAPGNAL